MTGTSTHTPPIIEVARALGLAVKETGDPGKAWVPCPATTHQDDATDPKCGISNCDDGGFFHCFKCDAKGDAVGLVKLARQCEVKDAFAWLRETFHLPDQRSGMNTSAGATVDPLTQLAARRRLSADKGLLIGQPSKDRNEVGFAMRDADGKIVGWRRRKGDGSAYAPGRKALTVTGMNNGLLGPWPIPASGIVLLVEGEMDVWAGLSAGWPAVVGTPGASPGKAVDQWLQRALAGRRVVLAPDPDGDGEKWRERVGRNLRAAGCEVFVIPALNGMDLDKRLQAASDPAAELARLIEEAIPWKATPRAKAKGKAREVPEDGCGTVSERCTDLFNAYRYQSLYGDLVLFDSSTGWRIYDPSEGRYRKARPGEVEKFAHKVARGILDEAKDASTEEATAKLAKWAVDSMDIARLNAMIKVGQSLMAISPDDLDPDPWLLNVQNGVVDLKTGELLPHDRGYMMTRCCSASYTPGLTHELLDRVLMDILPDPELRHYCQKLFGATLVGEQLDDLFILVYGPEATGKTTLTEPFRKLLNDYAAVCEPESLMVSRNGGGGAARGDIARLNGPRYVLVSEIEDGSKISVGLVKRMTGADRLTARPLYRDEIEFTPVFTLWFVSNHRPKADSSDGGLFRRVRVLPFDQTIPKAKRDPAVKKSMASECLPALLTWAVEGCLAFQREGLRTPAAVERAVSDYRDAMDPVRDFVDACCVVGPACRVDAGELRRAYTNYCHESGIKHPLSDREWGERLRMMGFEPVRFYQDSGTRTRGWDGVGLQDGTTGTTGTTIPKTFPYMRAQEKVSEMPVPPVPVVPSALAQVVENF